MTIDPNALLEPTALLGAIGLALVLPGLLSRRFGAWVVRGAALVALAAVWAAAMDWPETVRDERPVELRAVTTAAADGPWLARLRAAVELRHGRVDAIPAGNGGVAAALAEGALRGDADGLLCVWTGSFEPAERAEPAEPAEPLVPGLRAFSTAPAPPIEPDRFEVRALAALEAGRPGALELRVAPELGRDAAATEAAWEAELRVLGPDGREVRRDRFGAAELRGPREIALTPTGPGDYTVELRVEAAGTRIVATGRLAVRPPKAVLVVGRDARSVAQALVVQGVAATAATALPDDLGTLGVLVLTDPLPAEQQSRVAGFVDEGGGLLLIGREDDGGALPEAEDPLGPLSPVERVARDEPSGDAGAGAGAPQPDPDVEPEATEPPKPPPSIEPPAPAPEPTTEPDPGEPPVPLRGDTSAAAPPTGPAREVERRGIALVLVIDRSGSMDEWVTRGRTKMDYAKASAFETARSLEPGDELGIVSFGERAYPDMPLGPVPPQSELRARLERLRGVDRSTLVGDAVRIAGEWLAGSKAAIRHAVILTDGVLSDPGDSAFAQTSANRMREAGITVSLIQIVSSREDGGRVGEIARIPAFGGGKFMRSDDAASIPKLVFTEVERVLGAAGRRPAEEAGLAGAGDSPGREPVPGPPKPDAPKPELPKPEPPKPRPPDTPEPVAGPDQPTEPAGLLPVVAVGESVLLEPRPDGGFPPLRGIWPVAGKPEARVLLVAGAREGTPLLAFCNRGLGRVAAWTAGFSGPWSEAWRAADVGLPGRIAAWVESLRPAQASTADVADVLAVRSVEPPAPLRAEREFLARLAPGPLEQIDRYLPPPDREVLIERGRAVELALLALAALGVLALVEYLVRRYGVGSA